MERRFDMANFEQSLKDQADQFDMIPSSKVWHGIYNDLHPGSKWPSIAMGFVFLFTLFGIGHLNNSSKQIAGINPASEKNEPGTNGEKHISVTNSSETNRQEANSQKQIVNVNPISGKNQVVANTNKIDLQNGNADLENASAQGNAILKSTAKVIQLYPNGIDSYKNNISEQDNLKRNNSAANNKINNDNSETMISNSLENVGNDELKNNSDNSSYERNSIAKNNELIFTINNQIPDNLLAKISGQTDEASTIPLEKNITPQEIQMENNIAGDNKEQIENKKPVSLRKKRNEKINWVYFVTPSITTASFIGKGFQPIANPNTPPIIVQPNQKADGMIYNARLGYEFGAEMAYSFSKEWQFITGAHLSYSGYNIVSNQVHPTFATLLLKDEATGLPYSQSYITHYGNGQGQNLISLSNYSFQFSLPIGLQYGLFENEKFKINLASTIEPSLVLKSNSFIISSDGRYYVHDPSLLRKINLSGNFGSFVTFKCDKIKWQVGPSLRYQLLSTFQKNYPIKEHLIDYGIRIGISR